MLALTPIARPGKNGSCGLLRGLVFSALLSLATTAANAMEQVPEPSARLEAASPELHAAGLPILAMVRVVNSGSAPLSYSSGGPGRYPGADYFSATITDQQGNSQDGLLSNGQFENWKGGVFALDPGQATDVPLALPPLPPGEYTIVFSTGAPTGAPPRTMTFTVAPSATERKATSDGIRWLAATVANPLRVTVVEDRDAQTRLTQDLLGRARQGEPSPSMSRTASRSSRSSKRSSPISSPMTRRPA